MMRTSRFRAGVITSACRLSELWSYPNRFDSTKPTLSDHRDCSADLDASRTVRNCNAVELHWLPFNLDDAQTNSGVEFSNNAFHLRAHGTILEIGISTRSVAPASESAGINKLISLFGTTVSIAKSPFAS